ALRITLTLLVTQASGLDKSRDEEDRIMVGQSQMWEDNCMIGVVQVGVDLVQCIRPSGGTLRLLCKSRELSP
ncbi:hypothetical protein XENOCAPTIV_027770, partial [Xenoophorus captivus]